MCENWSCLHIGVTDHKLYPAHKDRRLPNDRNKNFRKYFGMRTKNDISPPPSASTTKRSTATSPLKNCNVFALTRYKQS